MECSRENGKSGRTIQPIVYGGKLWNKFVGNVSVVDGGERPLECTRGAVFPLDKQDWQLIFANVIGAIRIQTILVAVVILNLIGLTIVAFRIMRKK